MAGGSSSADVALNSVMEVARDLGRVGGDLREVAVGEDSLGVADREIFLAYQVHSEAIVIPETSTRSVR